MTHRGEYMSAYEAREAALAVGVELARDREPVDTFSGHRAADIADRAGVHKSAVHRHFDGLDELHTVAMVELADRGVAEQDSTLAGEVLDFLGVEPGGDLFDCIHRLSAASFELGLADSTVEVAATLATVAESSPRIAAVAAEWDAAAHDTMARLYAGIDETFGGGAVADGVELADMAAMIFALHDGEVLWNHVGGETRDGWDTFSVGVWGICQAFHPEGMK